MTLMGGMGGGGPIGAGPPGKPPSGMPFAGVPPEMQAGVDALLALEPPRPKPHVPFGYRRGPEESTRLTLWGLISRYPAMMPAAVTLVIVASVSLQAGPQLIGTAVNHGMTAGHKSFAVVAWISAAYFASIVLGGYAQQALVKVTGRLAAWVMHDLRITIFRHLQRLSLDFYTEEKVGVVMTRMTSDIENLQQLLQDGLAQFALQGLTMVVIATLLLVDNFRLGLITLVLVVPVLTGLSLWFAKASEKGYGRVRDGIAAVMADLSENLHGIRIVVAHNRQRQNVVSHRNIVGKYQMANYATARANAIYGPGTQFHGVLAQAAILGIGGYMVLHHEMSAGTLLVFFLYLSRFFQPIQLLVQQFNTFQQGQSSVFKLRTLLETEPSVDESVNPVELPPIEGGIVFEHVSFGYLPDVQVLEDVDLQIAPGETVAFVGPTGAGKSTIAKLVTRFYDPTSGVVRIDGYDLRDVSLLSLRRQLGVVPQEPFLFAGTIRDNLSFAQPGVSDDVVKDAVDQVGLRELIDRLPNGLDTVVHERGHSLSSGERQLIALTRAFLAQPRVLVLDEATSNLDLQSETRIEAALDVLLQDRTAVLIAHRLSTAMRADRIVVVDEGHIAEMGTHDELVAAGGRYADMYATWTRGSDATSPLELVAGERLPT